MASAWNLWHGCKKKSEGCQNCYIYRGDARRGQDASIIYKTDKFDYPVQRKKNGEYKTASGNTFYTCFSSDFLLPEADEWRKEAWDMIKERSDCYFFFLTKRPERLLHCVPEDWGDGYDNVSIGVSCENQKRADERLPLLLSLPIKHKNIILAPMLETMDIESYLGPAIDLVVCEGESGPNVRPLYYDWVLQIREQCIRKNVNFTFRQTGANFIKAGKLYHIQKRYQHSQARLAGIDYQKC